MKSQSLQELVKKIFGDEGTRAQFESNPESVMVKFDLTESERKAVMSTYSTMGIVTSDSPQMEAAVKPNVTWF
jgi:hypothetical protein